MNEKEIDRHWFLTWTTYGSRLPGDRRSFVSARRDAAGRRVRHNEPGTAYDADMPGLERYSKSILKGPVVNLNKSQAEKLFEQLMETAERRSWTLLAVGIMTQHVHLVVGVPGDPKPSHIRRDFKNYGSQVLNKFSGRPAGGRWWTDRGSVRKLSYRSSVLAAITYTVEQESPLLIWTAPVPELGLAGGRIV